MGNIAEPNTKSYRELQLEAKVKWATALKLNPKAIEHASRYLNLSKEELELISEYEYAAQLPAGGYREEQMRAAWHNVIFYLRSVARKEKDDE